MYYDHPVIIQQVHLLDEEETETGFSVRVCERTAPSEMQQKERSETTQDPGVVKGLKRNSCHFGERLPTVHGSACAAASEATKSQGAHRYRTHELVNRGNIIKRLHRGSYMNNPISVIIIFKSLHHTINTTQSPAPCGQQMLPRQTIHS